MRPVRAITNVQPIGLLIPCGITDQLQPVDLRMLFEVAQNVSVWHPRTDDAEREQFFRNSLERYHVLMLQILPHRDVSIERLIVIRLYSPFGRNTGTYLFDLFQIRVCLGPKCLDTHLFSIQCAFPNICESPGRVGNSVSSSHSCQVIRFWENHIMG